MSRLISIKEIAADQAKALNELARQTFVESHGRSAKPADIEAYMDANFTVSYFKNELKDSSNYYHSLHVNNQWVGYSKLVFNQPISAVEFSRITKLERIYLLETHHGMGLAQQFLDFLVQQAKKTGQTGMWLNVWTENKRAIRFYEKNKFETVGTFDFKISEQHSNPNWRMFLKF